MTSSLLHCTRSCPANGLWLGLCLSWDAQNTHADTNTETHAWAFISTTVYRHDCTDKNLCALLHSPRSTCKQKYTPVMWWMQGLNLAREKETEMCGLRNYPIDLSIFLHTWLPLQNMPSAFHSMERWGRKQRWKMEYHSCINNWARVCSACDNAQLLIHLSVITCVYKHTQAPAHWHAETTLCKLKKQPCGLTGKETRTKVRQQMQRQRWCLNTI